MSMDDLVKRLRELDDDSFVETMHGPAADRIEELEAKLLSATMDGYDMAKHEYRDRIEELEAKLAELLAVSKRAVRLSLDHSDFKLYAMEPMHQAITAAELKGQNDG